MEKNTPLGCLYVVATPIGNMGDMTLRALEVLQSVDFIYAEDTRQTGKLLQYFSISTTIYQLHKHNENSQKNQIAKDIDSGKNIAIVSDAGTPLIADPGYVTLAHLRRNHYPIYVIPGCSAMIAALSISGLPTDQFQFAGFLPSKPNQRKIFLKNYRYCRQTTVFFETPHRIVDCINDCLAIFGGQRQLFIGRELTKQFEESILLPLSELPEWLLEHDFRIKGEFVLILSPTEDHPEKDWQVLVRIMAAEKIPTKTIARVVASYIGVNKNLAYQFALTLDKA